ncbi:hypothetical protein [Variovorax sp. GT1P44]|uniref:hypothetical protein n=1 Tax=Variovorax sp. GT1P44 TaxID=3443742 RepID=UPI003F4886D6
MFELLSWWPQRTAKKPDGARNLFGWRTAAMLVACASVVGCDLTPNVLFVADGSPMRLLQLTDAQDECAAPSRVCFLSTWDGQTARGCWLRDKAQVRVVFSNEEQTVPLSLFRPTAYAEHRRASLD